MKLKTIILAPIASLWIAALAAPVDESHSVARYDRKPSVQCGKPLSKFRVVYQVDKPNRSGEFRKEIEAQYICIEKDRISTESGMLDIQIYLMSINNAYQQTIIGVTPMTE